MSTIRTFSSGDLLRAKAKDGSDLGNQIADD
jgi:hypothetical protein